MLIAGGRVNCIIRTYANIGSCGKNPSWFAIRTMPIPAIGRTIYRIAMIAMITNGFIPPLPSPVMYIYHCHFNC